MTEVTTQRPQAGPAEVDRITRRLLHTSQHNHIPIFLAGRVQQDINLLRESFGLPEFGWNDSIPDQEVGRCTVHSERCEGQHTHTDEAGTRP